MILFKYDRLKRLLFAALFVLSSLFVSGQTDTDSVYYEPADTSIVPDNYEDESTDDKPSYFLDKESQTTGGGPDSIQYRKLPDSVVEKLKNDDDFWYANYVFEKEKRKETKAGKVPFFQTDGFRTFLWLLTIAAFIAVIYVYLLNSNVQLFRKANRTIPQGDEAAFEGADNIFEINYQLEIDKAISKENYRLATRLMFLRLLKNLADKNIINYKQDRTNFDYLLQLNSTRYYNDFFRLTRFYEYAWYGQFDIEAANFPVIKNDFENFERSLQ